MRTGTATAAAVFAALLTLSACGPQQQPGAHPTATVTGQGSTSASPSAAGFSPANGPPPSGEPATPAGSSKPAVAVPPSAKTPAPSGTAAAKPAGLECNAHWYTDPAVGTDAYINLQGPASITIDVTGAQGQTLGTWSGSIGAGDAGVGNTFTSLTNQSQIAHVTISVTGPAGSLTCDAKNP